jgi:hypothetical protein
MRSPFLFLLLAIIFTSCSGNSSNNPGNTATVAKKYPGIGETIKTGYFEVKVTSAKFYKFITAREGLINFKKDAKDRYLLLGITIKNTDKEARTLFDAGPILINVNNKEYSFDRPEPTNAEGWGLSPEALNPTISKSTFLVYKIPREMTGDVLWRPNRADVNQKIALEGLNF